MGSKKTGYVPPKCPFCRAADKPGSVAFALGFVAGAKFATNDLPAKVFGDDICEAHAKMAASIMRGRMGV